MCVYICVVECKVWSWCEERERREVIVETKREEKRTCHASDVVYDVFDVV